MERQVNIFNKGMAQDLAPGLQAEGTYFEAINMRPVTDGGKTTGALVNIDGNTLFVTFPTTSNVVEIQNNGITGAYSFTLTINTVVVTVTGTYTNDEDLYNTIATAINADVTLASPAFLIKAYYSSSHVVISSAIDPTTNLIPTAAITVISSTIQLIVDNTYVQSTGQPKTLGWGLIRETLYYFTCDDSVGNLGASQIWSLTYDKVNPLSAGTSPVLTLLYNNNMDLSLDFPIAHPGMIIGRYETNLIQRLYWTDNNNVPRKFNVVDPQGFAVDLTQLEWSPNILFNVPILQEIIQAGGAVKTGVWQFAYALSSSGGSQTGYSIPSNEVNIINVSEGIQFEDYFPNGINTVSSKQIKYKINNIDIAYDRIKVVSIYKQSASGTPEINIILDEPINGNDFTFTYTGTETTIPITVEEFQAANVVFRKVGTLASKANRLVVANITTSNFDLDFDARAYRFDRTGTAEVVDASGLNPIPVDPTSVATYPNQWDIPEKHDACNPSDDPTDIDGFFYQSNGLTIGGEGPNVKYRFVTPSDPIDNLLAILGDTHDPASVLGGGVAVPAMFGIGSDSFLFDLNTTFEQYAHINTYRDYHSPYISSAMKQYLRDEIYRFGIIFFSKKGEASFVKWIGDIRIPHTFMYDALSGSRDPNAAEDNYFPVADGSNNSTIFHPMGVKFTVDTSTVQDLISGFSIVRVKREKEDRTIMDQGMLFPAFLNAANEITTLPDDTSWNLEADPTATGSVTVSNEACSFNSPAILFSKEQPGNTTGDIIEVTTLVELTVNNNLADTLYVDQGAYKKLNKYNFVEALPPTIERYPVAKAYLAVSAEEVGNSNKDYSSDIGTPVRTRNRSSGNNNGYTSIGGRTTLLKITTGQLTGVGLDINSLADTVVEPAGIVPLVAYIANFKRLRPLQYGGKTYSQRSTNEYMLTGHFQPLITGQTTYTDMVVYGGDTYLCMFDNVKQFPIRNGESSIANVDQYDESFFVGKVFPVESTVNINLRRGLQATRAQIFNKEAITSVNYPAPTNIITDEFFDCIDLYSSSENDILKFHPRPDPFVTIEEFDNRIHASQAKINGELTDSWSIFKVNDLVDVEGIYGPITGLFILKDKLIFTQNRAFGTAAINERIMLEDTNSNTIGVGTGAVLDRYDYYSTTTGCKAIFGVTITEQGMYWIDVLSKKVFRWTGGDKGGELQPLSDARDMSSFFSNNIIGDGITNDNPFRGKGISSVFDHEFGEVIWSYKDSAKTFTIVFNESKTIQAFTGLYTYSSPMFCNDKYNVFAVDPSNLNAIYLQNTGSYCVFFDQLTPAPSSLRYVVNPHPNTIKVFDNQELNLESKDRFGVDQPTDNFTRCRYLTNNQNSDWRATATISKRKERRWNYLVARNRVLYTTPVPDILTDLSPIDKPYGERLRDHQLICDLEYDNALNNEITLTAVDTIYRLSAR